jgi:hypothetical protein
MFLSLNSNRTGVTFGVGTAIHSRAPEFNSPVFIGFVSLYLLFSVLCFSDFYPFSFVCPCSTYGFWFPSSVSSIFSPLNGKMLGRKMVLHFCLPITCFSTCRCHITSSARQTDSLLTKMNGSMTCICIYIYNVF